MTSSVQTVQTITAQECESLFQAQPHINGTALPVCARTWQALNSGELPLTSPPWWMHIDAGKRTASATARALIWIDPALDCLAGHFPGQPIIPGVVQIDWAAALAAAVIPDASHATFCGLARVKFKAPVLPGAIVALALTASPGKVVFSLTSPSVTHTQASLLYRER